MSSIVFFFIFVSILALIFLIVNFLFAPRNSYPEKYSIFECGFHSFLGQNRVQFAIVFFLYGITYLLLDLELILVYPFSQSEYINSSYGFVSAISFIIIISIGLVFELGTGALKIDSKQNTNQNLNKNKLSSNITSLQLRKFSTTSSNRISKK